MFNTSMITTKSPLMLHDKQGNQLLSKATIAGLFCLFIIQAAPALGPIATFIGFDLILSVYLISLFRNKLSFLFLLHPLVALITSYGFEMPYTEIGVAFTYLDTFNRFVDPTSLTIDIDSLWSALLPEEAHEGTNYGIGVVYVGVIPILWLPAYLFTNAPDIVIYLSLGVFTMLYAAISVSVALAFGVLRKDVLLIIALYCTVSPTFLEINSTLHRYGLLFFGLFLFLIAYIGLLRGGLGLRKLMLLALILVAMALVSASKAPLLLSLVMFVLLEFFSRNKLPLLSKIFYRLNNPSRVWFLIIMIAIAQYLAHFIAPEKYVTGFSQQGGQYEALINIPILGLLVRLFYAMLSPFPWINFSQLELYGYNTLLFLLHIPSALLAAWIIFSFFSRTRQIVTGNDDIKITALFGVAIMSSLTFSAIGFHVYLSPALPFIAVILLNKKTRISLTYPILFIIGMELIAQIAKVMR